MRLCAAGLIIALSGFLLLRQRPVLPFAAGAWLCGFLLLALTSSFWAIDPGEARERTLKAALVLLPGLFLLGRAGMGGRFAALAPDAPGLWLIPVLYLAAALLLAAEMWGGLPLYHLVHDIPFSKRVRLDFVNRHVIALVLLAPPVLALALSGASPRAMPPRWLAGIIALALALVLARTVSQSAQLAALAMLFFAVLFPHRLRSAWIGLMALLAAGVMAAPWLAQAMFAQRALLSHVPIIGNPAAYAANRLEVWDYVSRYALQRPLHGFGIEATRVIDNFDSAQLYQAGTSILHPHNVALQLWMEFGAIGALLGAAFLLHMVWRIWRLPLPARRVALTGFMGCLSVGAMSYGLWQGWWLGLLLLIAALTVLAARVAAGAPVSAAAQPATQDDGRTVFGSSSQ